MRVSDIYFILPLFVCTAAFITLRPIIMVELLGIQQLTNAYGLSCLFLGVAYIVGSPISGQLSPSLSCAVSSLGSKLTM